MLRVGAPAPVVPASWSWMRPWPSYSQGRPARHRLALCVVTPTEKLTDDDSVENNCVS